MITEEGRKLINAKLPTLYPRVQLLSDQGVVIFQSSIDQLVRPGDTINVEWKYDGPS